MDPKENKDAYKPALDSVKITETKVCPTCGIRLSCEISICPNDKTVLLNRSGLGTKLSQSYEIIEEIGSGGMGVVYKGRHMALNTMVAIKMLNVSRLDEVAMQRFAQEAKAISLLDHCRIVNIRDYGVTESGQPYMVLDYADADTLEQTIAWRGPCSLENSLDIFIQVTDALAHAHERNILHRDIKPSNIMLIKTDDGVPSIKIVDFGIAKITDAELDGQTNLTRSGEVFGSPLYMSPEQASGTKLDQRSDIYSLGCVMYETLTGVPPFPGKSAIEILTSQLNDEAPTLHDGSLGTNFPANVEAIIKKSLCKDPNQRFQSMAELKESLGIARSGGSLPVQELTAEQAALASKQRAEAILWRVVACVISCALAAAFAVGWQTMHEPHPTNAVLTGAPLESKFAFNDSGARQAIKAGANQREINLRPFEVSDSDLAQFDTLRSTEAVDLQSAAVKGPGLAHLIHLPLKYLNLEDSDVTDRGLQEIKHMDHLVNLNLVGTKIDDAGLENLSEIKSLNSLALTLNGLSSKGIINLHRLPNLQYLFFSKNSISAEGVAELGHFPALRALFLEDLKIDDDSVKHLKDCKLLDHLSLTRTNITPTGLAYLADLPALNSLELASCSGLNDLDYGVFKNFKSLVFLNLSGNEVSLKSLNQLKSSPVRRLNLSHCDISDKGLAILSDNDHLLELTIHSCPNVSKAAIEAFHKKRPLCRIDQG